MGAKISIYYLGTLFGCLFGGSYGDRHGRIQTIGLGAAWAVFGALLQMSAQNQYWMIFGRVPYLVDLCSLCRCTRIYYNLAYKDVADEFSSSPDQWFWYRHAQRRCSCVGY